MPPALRTAVAIVLGAVVGVGSTFLAEIAVTAARPLLLGLPLDPFRIDVIPFLGPHSLAATLTGLAMGPIAALIAMATIDRPSLRGGLGVLLGAGGAAALVVALVQGDASPAIPGAPDLTGVVVGLGALVVVSAALATADRELIVSPAPAALGLVAALVPLGVVALLGRPALEDAWLEVRPPTFPRFEAALVAAEPIAGGAAATAGGRVALGGVAYTLAPADALGLTSSEVLAVDWVARDGERPAALSIRLVADRAADLARRTHARRGRHDVFTLDGQPVAVILYDRLLLTSRVVISGREAEPALAAAYRKMTAAPP